MLQALFRLLDLPFYLLQLLLQILLILFEHLKICIRDLYFASRIGRRFGDAARRGYLSGVELILSIMTK